VSRRAAPLRATRPRAAVGERRAAPADAPRIHPTAIVEPGAVIGPRTAIWDNAHVRAPAEIGHDCIVGEKTYIAYGVRIGDYVKINAQAYLCTGVTIEDRAFVAAGVIFTNDRHPRAFADGHEGLAPSEPTDDTLATFVRTGATIGAGAVIGPGLEIGAYAMVGMGSVVARDVPPHGLVYGTPARLRGYVCVCGAPIAQADDGGATSPDGSGCTCERCGRRYAFCGVRCTLVDGPERR
jgi:UDP-2-acetamido-3-amino-2,3-dideoxy-glucuronate N-acetyltransferase